MSEFSIISTLLEAEPENEDADELKGESGERKTVTTLGREAVPCRATSSSMACSIAAAATVLDCWGRRACFPGDTPTGRCCFSSIIVSNVPSLS